MKEVLVGKVVLGPNNLNPHPPDPNWRPSEIPDVLIARVRKPVYDLIARWRKDADQYAQQVEEAKSKGTPWVDMEAYRIQLRICARELEKAIGK